MKLRTLLIGVELSALLSCTTSCILEFPTLIDICDTEWQSDDSELGYVELSFKCYDNGKHVFLTQIDGTRQMGYWEARNEDTCSYNLHLTGRTHTTNREIELISAEIQNCSESPDTMTVSWFYTTTPTTLHTSTFIRIKTKHPVIG